MQHLTSVALVVGAGQAGEAIARPGEQLNPKHGSIQPNTGTFLQSVLMTERMPQWSTRFPH